MPCRAELSHEQLQVFFYCVCLVIPYFHTKATEGFLHTVHCALFEIRLLRFTVTTFMIYFIHPNHSVIHSIIQSLIIEVQCDITVYIS